MYTRASASDYDDWKTVHENTGWCSEDLIPLLKKVSRLHTWAIAFILTSFFRNLSGRSFADGDVPNSQWRANARYRWPSQGLPSDVPRLWRSVPTSYSSA